MRIVHRMNQGTDLAGTSIGAATRFAVGCGVNPTAEDLDAEFEYVKRKLDAGPQFVDDPAGVRAGVLGALRRAA